MMEQLDRVAHGMRGPQDEQKKHNLK